MENMEKIESVDRMIEGELRQCFVIGVSCDDDGDDDD